MQESNIDKPKFGGKKPGGFLFAAALENTQEERKTPEQQELERSLAPSVFPSSIPLSNFDDNNKMATASSLKERLKQYQSLKAEQSAAPPPPRPDPESDSFLGPPIPPKPEESKVEESKDQSPPGKISVKRLIKTSSIYFFFTPSNLILNYVSHLFCC
jgi:hypothetical protein